MADMHRVRVHHPRHHALVGVDVRRRHVGVGAEHVDDPRRVATRHFLELGRAHGLRIAPHATLRAAEGNVDHRAFPGHPGGESLHLFERDVEVEPDATLRRPARSVVLNPISLVHFDLAVVQHDRDRDDHLLLSLTKHLVQALLQIEKLSGLVEPRHHRLEWILLIEESVLVGSNEFMGRNSNVCGHEVDCRSVVGMSSFRLRGTANCRGDGRCAPARPPFANAVKHTIMSLLRQAIATPVSLHP